MKPLIGVTCKYSYDGTFAVEHNMGIVGQQWHYLPHDYIHAIEMAGGIPVILPIYDDIQNAIELCKSLDGVVFTGGNDVNPVFYGEFPMDNIGIITPGRDLQEIELIKYILSETEKPLLGICRGTQILNVALGGTLCQDLVEKNFNNHSIVKVPGIYASHEIIIEEKSKLFNIMQNKKSIVNSFHHQAVDKLGAGLVVTARASDGIIEAMEYLERDAYTLGVQWHPECMVDRYKDHLNIFKSFIDSIEK